MQQKSAGERTHIKKQMISKWCQTADAAGWGPGPARRPWSATNPPAPPPAPASKALSRTCPCTWTLQPPPRTQPPPAEPPRACPARPERSTCARCTPARCRRLLGAGRRPGGCTRGRCSLCSPAPGAPRRRLWGCAASRGGCCCCCCCCC